jgi:hypothetical protein
MASERIEESEIEDQSSYSKEEERYRSMKRICDQRASNCLKLHNKVGKFKYYKDVRKKMDKVVSTWVSPRI